MENYHFYCTQRMEETEFDADDVDAKWKTRNNWNNSEEKKWGKEKLYWQIEKMKFMIFLLYIELISIQ